MTFASYSWIRKFFLGKIFNPSLSVDVDLVVVYQNAQPSELEALKHEIDALFSSYFVESVKIVFFSEEQFEMRYKMADKFVLSLLKFARDWERE